MSRSFIPTAGLMADRQSNGDDDLAIGAEAIAPDESDTLASAVSEINEAEGIMTDGVAQIEAGAAATDGLETLGEKVEAINEAEGMTPEVADMVESAMESFHTIARMGYSRKSIGVPSSESFRSVESRKQLGDATVEAIGAQAKKIWQSIIDAIKKSIDWVVGFFNKIFGGAERLERRAQALKEKLGEMGDKQKEAQIKDESLASSVSIKGSAANANDLKKLSSQVKSIFAAQKKTVDSLAGGTGETIDVSPGTYGLKNAGSAGSKISADSGVTVSISEVFPGEMVAYLVTPKLVQPNMESASKVKGGSAKIAESKLKEVPTLSKADVGTIAEGVEALAKEVVAYKANLSDITAKKKSYIATLEKNAKEDSKEDKNAKQTAKAHATVFRRLMDEPAASVAVLAVKAGSAMLQYAERSARQYVADKKE